MGEMVHCFYETRNMYKMLSPCGENLGLINLGRWRLTLKNFIMFNLDNLTRVLSLIQKTGDKVVLIPEGGEPIVLMSLKQYESLSAPAKQVLAGGVMFRVTSEDVTHLKGLTEDQMLEKVNREIAIWRENQATETMVKNREPETVNPLGSRLQDNGSGESAEEEKFYIEPVEQL